MEQEHTEQQSTITDQVIGKIEQDNVTPIARWHFVLKNNSFWVLWGVSVLVGSCATAASIFVFIHSGWKYEAITHDSFLQFFFDIVPLFWLASFGLMVLFGYYNVRHTSRGYRFSFYLIIIASILASVVGGILLYVLGIAGDIDDLRRPIPFASPIMYQEVARWNDNTRGLISGVVTAYDEEKNLLTLNAFSGEERILSTSELEDMDIDRLAVGAQIRIIGGFSIDNPALFIACAVLPWEIQGVHYNPPQIHLPKDIQRERKTMGMRTSICKDVRPYARYKELFITN